MTATVMQNKAVYKTEEKKQQKKSGFRERFVNYMKGNGAEIACSMIAMNEGMGGYHLYAALKDER